MPKPLPLKLALVVALTLAASGPAGAQLLGGRGGGLGAQLPAGLPSPGLSGPADLPQPQVRAPARADAASGLFGDVSRNTRDLTDAPARALDQATRHVLGTAATVADAVAPSRRALISQLLREHPEAVEADERGDPVVRGQVLALSPSPDAIARARQAGFRVSDRRKLAELGLETVTFTAPRGLSAVEAVRRLRTLDPAGQYDFDHLYQPSGGALSHVSDAHAAGAGEALATGGEVRIGLVDGSVAAGHPSLAHAHIVQRAFAPGGPEVSAHATAVASLLAGGEGRFQGAAPGARIWAADVYGPTPAGGSADAIARALAWLAQNRVGVVNISLVGPPNLVLGAAVRALSARGTLVVAAVGNDGPAAPPLYPASYPGVVAVTAVDARRQVLPEASRATHVDFAAPGAEMAAAGLGGGFAVVRGTSFAAPLVAGELARRLPRADPAAAAAAVAALSRTALDLGARGPDPVYGRGAVALDLRTDPVAVAARGSLRGP